MIAICTAFNKALLAAQKGDKIKTQELDAQAKHSESVLPALAEMLSGLNLSVQGEDEYAVVIGPGSFTGLRLGLALVKGLIAGSGKGKVIPITSFELLAYSYVKTYAPKQDFTVVIDALSGLCFTQTFDKNGKAKDEGRLVSVSTLTDDTVKVCHSQDKFDFVKVSPSADDLLGLALSLKKTVQFAESNALEPLYLRQSQAEANLQQKSLKKV